MKFSLIALHLAAVLQFLKTPHFVQRKVTRENGDIVNVNSGNGNSVSYASTGEGDKKKFVINVTVSTGPGLYTPVLTTFADAADADRVIQGLKAGLEAAGNDDAIAEPEIIVPDEA